MKLITKLNLDFQNRVDKFSFIFTILEKHNLSSAQLQETVEKALS
jgi:hypothetical protein